MTEKLAIDPASWRTRLATTPAGISAALARVQTIAVIGIKPQHVGGPAWYVPAYAQAAGLTIIPVPVYYPDVTQILGVPVHRSLASIAPPADMALLFRRSEHVAGHLNELLAARPAVVWMQSGIRDAVVAETLATAGIVVVQDRCLKIELEQRGH